MVHVCSALNLRSLTQPVCCLVFSSLTVIRKTCHNTRQALFHLSGKTHVLVIQSVGGSPARESLTDSSEDPGPAGPQACFTPQASCAACCTQDLCSIRFPSSGQAFDEGVLKTGTTRQTREVFLENKNTAKSRVSLASYKQKLQAFLNLYLPLTRYNFHL